MPSRVWPIIIIFVSMAFVQGSSSLAKHLFPLAGPAGMTAWRLLFSSIMLSLIFKPWRKPIAATSWKYIILYGFSLGFMNFCFYSSIERIPIGISVALELTGPIAVAICSARRLLDFTWLAFAVIGLAILLPIEGDHTSLDTIGILLALCAGACWALYIIFGRKAGQVHGSSSVAIGSIAVSCVIFPIGIWQSGASMFSLTVIPSAFLVALMASAIPYALDMIALPKISSSAFSMLMSLSPVIAALSGFTFLNEKLTHHQWIAILLIIISSVGTIISINRKPKIKKVR